MIKISILAMFLILLSSSAGGEDIFAYAPLKEIQVIEADGDAGSALIKDRQGDIVEIFIDDRIGLDLAPVAEIDDGSITVDLGDARTKIPVVHGFER